MKFAKMNGLGNDYIFVDTAIYNIENPRESAKKLSDRHRGIGGDGLVLIGRSGEADFSMRIFNADGSEGEMCGNALRCLGKYVYEKGLTEKTELTVLTKAGIKRMTLNVVDGAVGCVNANIGKPLIGYGGGPKEEFKRLIEVGGKSFIGYCVSIGNPHCVIFVKRFFDDIMEIGREISENTRYFPNRTNVEFVLEDSSCDILTMRVYERGSGETMACGTGAAASFYVANLLDIVGNGAIVRLPGGDIRCEKNAEGEVIISGPAEFNFEGEIE